MTTPSPSSVDAFLEQPENQIFEGVGKAAIAAALIDREDHNSLIYAARNAEDAWYEYIWNRLFVARDIFSKNRFSVITFNYDRSLEHYLFTCIKQSYHGISDEDAADLLQQTIQIVHVYGQLGHLPYSGSAATAVRPYENRVNKDSIAIAADQIKIAHEGAQADEEFMIANDLISQASTICYLGFAYHPQNVERLQLDKIDWAQKKSLCLRVQNGRR